MKRRLRLIDLTQMFLDSENPRVVNSEDLHSANLESDFNDTLFMNMDQELGFVATCKCGRYQGNQYEGMTCPRCNQRVSTEFIHNLGHKNWLSIPDTMPKVLHPLIYLMLRNWTASTKGSSLLDNILNPNAKLPPEVKSHIRGQGYKYFYEHFDEILHYLSTVYHKTKNSKSTPMVLSLLQAYSHCIFTSKLPILDPSLHPMSKEGKRRTLDGVAGEIKQAVTDLSFGAFAIKRTVAGDRRIDRTLWKVYERYIKYVQHIISKKIGDKRAHVRRHQLGTRLHFSFRAVIVPMVGPHMADELHLPWKVAVNGLRLEIINLLMTRYNHEFNDAVRRHVNSLVVYDPLIDEIIQTLIAECPYKGLPVLFGRNPTLQHGAIQLLFVTRVKKQVDDETIAFSPLITSAPNADYDYHVQTVVGLGSGTSRNPGIKRERPCTG